VKCSSKNAAQEGKQGPVFSKGKRLRASQNQMEDGIDQNLGFEGAETKKCLIFAGASRDHKVPTSQDSVLSSGNRGRTKREKNRSRPRRQRGLDS